MRLQIYNDADLRVLHSSQYLASYFILCENASDCISVDRLRVLEFNNLEDTVLPVWCRSELTRCLSNESEKMLLNSFACKYYSLHYNITILVSTSTNASGRSSSDGVMKTRTNSYGYDDESSAFVRSYCNSMIGFSLPKIDFVHPRSFSPSIGKPLV